jgi:SHS2 domain-containing protein
MSVGNDLQEMEVSTKKSTSAVNKGSTAGEGMRKATIPGEGLVNSVEDLGGPTPQNSKPTDDSNKYKTPAAKLSAVRDVQHRNAKAPDPMQHANKAAWSYEETESDEENLVLESEEVEEEEVEGEEVVEEEISIEEKINNIINSEVDYSADINALSEGEDLSEAFTAKAATIFEAAVKSKLVSAVEVMQEEYQKNLVEEVTTIKEELTERVDSYLEYVSQQWIEENSIQLESGIKGELAESFMSKLKGLFEEHYVEIPEDRYNVLEGMVERLDEMEEKLNEQIERNVQLNKRLSEAVSDSILNDVSEGLALTQKEKLASLAESVEFNSEEDYREKLETLKESYFPRNSVSAREEMLVEQASEVYTPQMDAYLRAVSKFSQ